ncbi:MAG TPA: twin-arginine translocase TatA/TatE family subunit [Bacteroidia bacterium]|nr:twin-arginine translocase TatA/TatE family subunit [Bacteroidia bacterium]HNT79965.1 twin-arginine translocase TatA/TatE family subunit [Bacteroidia bacterium]
MIILFLESLGGGELIVIFIFVLFFFGSKKIPELARGLGSGMRQFKDAMNGVQRDINDAMHEDQNKKHDNTNSNQKQIEELKEHNPKAEQE